MTKRWIYNLSALLIVAALIVFAAFYFVGNSTASRMARQLITSSPEVSRSIGVLKEIKLRPMSSKYSESETSGHAELSFSLKGDRRGGIMIVTLNKSNGIWAVVSASLNGEEVHSARAPST